MAYAALLIRSARGSGWTSPIASAIILPFANYRCIRGVGERPAGAVSPMPGFGMWHNLLVALALVLVMEGIWPFLSPGGMRRALLLVAAQDDFSLRVTGLVSMLVGVATLYLVN